MRILEWQRDEDIPLSDVLGAAITSTTAAQITVTYAEYFNLNDVILIDSELMHVLATDATNNYLTVTRGFAGSTAATHLISTTIYRLGSARPEGSSPGWAQQTVTSQPHNYCQIFDETVSITGTQQATRYYGVDDKLAYQVDKAMASLYMKMERALLYNSYRYAGTATAPRLTGGADFFVYDKNNLSSAAITQDDVEDALQDKFSSFGMNNIPDTMYCNAWVRRKVSSWGTGTIVTERTENVVGNVVDQIYTNFGTVTVELDHLVIPSHAWLFNMDKITIAPMNGRGFSEIEASTPGTDATIRRILGEYAFIFHGEDGAADGLNVKIYGISTNT